MPNVKAGDLAIVINAYYCTENIGRIVEVMRRAVPGIDVSLDTYGIAWVVRSDRPLGRTAGGYRDLRLRPALVAPFADENLRPVSGLSEPAESKKKQHA